MNFRNLSLYYFVIVVASRFLGIKRPNGVICLVANSTNILATHNQNVARRNEQRTTKNNEVIKEESGFDKVAKTIQGVAVVCSFFYTVYSVVVFCIIATILTLIINWFFFGFWFLYVLIACVTISFFLIDSVINDKFWDEQIARN
ncbi:hypothetical protein NBO_4g0061 [Nosema bombycis CQ1]|uniref:Transmembrane protein n=1 Tax=Nosema bombycis (strain CQ1 / CVCC 102059) TaxID=578461 RepID=R0MRC2_NOSB1|nr:hypothetical protein NBO_4g0061 [Nosema bombycis CQ1]|eukprot:EOB15433.1 hypothetical protein NBO_4g0061 [Nosema bombycis CQ1]